MDTIHHVQEMVPQSSPVLDGERDNKVLPAIGLQEYQRDAVPGLRNRLRHPLLEVGDLGSRLALQVSERHPNHVRRILGAFELLATARCGEAQIAES